MDLCNIPSNSQSNNCTVCSVSAAKYTCPRCNIQYCSLPCYKSANHLQCTEQFYRESVEEELGSMQSGSEDKRKMTEILLKMKREMDGTVDGDNAEEEEDDDQDMDSDDDSANLDDLQSRLENVDLSNSEEVCNHLNQNELKDFVKMVATGKILEILPAWTPWWIDDSVEQPALAQNVPTLSQILRSEPSPNMPSIVLNTVLAYLFTARLLRGEVYGFCIEATSAIISLSSTLKGNAAVCASCQTFHDANQLFEAEVSECGWLSNLNIEYDRDQITLDQRELLGKGTTAVLKALSDINLIFQMHQDTIKNNETAKRFTGEPASKSAVMKASKKITFYLSWTKEAFDQVWDGLPITLLEPDD